MEISVHQPAYFSEIGMKKNNEDSIFPNKNAHYAGEKVFLCCDGVGGSPSGKIASEITCHYFARYFKTRDLAVTEPRHIQEAIDSCRIQLKKYEMAHPESAGMKTTLTALILDDAGAGIAWMGDSRIYHIRNGEVLYRTWDHSYVNTLVEKGLLTEAETRNHPQRNIITRTLGTAKSERKADFQRINDVMTGDFFLLCSDGLLEMVTDELLQKWLIEKADPDWVKTQVLTQCTDQTYDNFSMVLVKVKSIAPEVSVDLQ